MRPRAEVKDIYDAYSRSVFRRARSLLCDEDEARDACHEVFLRLMRLDAGSQLQPSPLAWLYRATTNLCLNRLRDEKRRGQLLRVWNPNLVLDAEDGVRQTVERILREIPEELQEAAIYYYVDGMSHEEIAEVTGASRRTVGNRLVAFHIHAQTAVKDELRS